MKVLIMDMGNDLRGESSLPGYEGKIDLLSFSHGVAMQITGDAGNRERTSGKPNHMDLTVTKYLDALSPVLNQACCAGKAFPKIDVIIGRNDNGKVSEMMRYTIKNVIISSVSIGGGGGDNAIEAITLNYTHIAWRFTSEESDQGSPRVVEGKWDLEKNRAS